MYIFQNTMWTRPLSVTKGSLPYTPLFPFIEQVAGGGSPSSHKPIYGSLTIRWDVCLRGWMYSMYGWYRMRWKHGGQEYSGRASVRYSNAVFPVNFFLLKQILVSMPVCLGRLLSKLSIKLDIPVVNRVQQQLKSQITPNTVELI